MASSSSPMPQLNRLLGGCDTVNVTPPRNPAVGAHRAVLPGALGLVERMVGGGHQRVLVGVVGSGERGDAERGGDLERPLARGQRQLEVLDRAPDALGELVGALEVGLRERDAHLLAAVTGGLVDLA